MRDRVSLTATLQQRSGFEKPIHEAIRLLWCAATSLSAMALYLENTMRRVALLALALLNTTSVFAASPACSVSMSQDPVVLRVGKDEFRIAFGLNGEQCSNTGCAGTIDYRAAWKADDGTTRSEQKHLSYSIPDGAKRSLVVDRHYFDTSEGKHTTDITKVSVDSVSCESSPARATAAR